MPETSYDSYRRRYLVEDSSQCEPAEIEADPIEAALREQIRALKQQLATAEAALEAAERLITNR